MERVCRKDIQLFTLVGILLGLTPQSLWADTGDPARSIGSEDSYPESRFGQEPPRIGLGVDKGYAEREVDRYEHRDGGRSLAQLSLPEQGTQSHENHPRSADLEASLEKRNGVQEIALIANDLGYFPKTIFVNRDVPVRLFVTGSSKNTLCIMMDTFQARKQIRSQKIEEISFTPNVPGRYRFYCPVNGMEGLMVVRELNSTHLAQSQ